MAIVLMAKFTGDVTQLTRAYDEAHRIIMEWTAPDPLTGNRVEILSVIDPPRPLRGFHPPLSLCFLQAAPSRLDDHSVTPIVTLGRCDVIDALVQPLVVVVIDETVDQRLDLPRWQVGGVGFVDPLALERRDPRLARGIVGWSLGAREALHDAEIEENCCVDFDVIWVPRSDAATGSLGASSASSPSLARALSHAS